VMAICVASPVDICMFCCANPTTALVLENTLVSATASSGVRAFEIYIWGVAVDFSWTVIAWLMATIAGAAMFTSVSDTPACVKLPLKLETFVSVTADMVFPAAL
jgi:hypothetical protein